MSLAKECKACGVKLVFDGLVEMGFTADEAFHMSIGALLEKEVTRAIDEGFHIGYEAGEQDGKSEAYEAGYSKGYDEACQDMAEVATAYSRNVSELH